MSDKFRVQITSSRVHSDKDESTWLSRLEHEITVSFRKVLASGKPLRVLEVGGGANTRLQMDVPFIFTVVDISKEQLERNTYASEKICADIMKVQLTPSKYHIAVSWDVLEHLPDPKGALERVAAAIGGDGFIILAGPDPRSLKGMVTRFTPHAFHVFFYRYMLKRKSAGMPGRAPFPTYMSPNARPEALIKTLEDAGFTIILLERSVSKQVKIIKQNYYSVYCFYRALSSVLKLFSANKYGRWETDFIIIAQKSVSAPQLYN